MPSLPEPTHRVYIGGFTFVELTAAQKRDLDDKVQRALMESPRQGVVSMGCTVAAFECGLCNSTGAEHCKHVPRR